VGIGCQVTRANVHAFLNYPLICVLLLVGFACTHSPVVARCSSNYFEDNNLHVPAYNIAGHLTPIFGDVILTGTGGSGRGSSSLGRGPWNLPYSFDSVGKDYSCTDAMINASECVVPVLESHMLGVMGASIESNTFVAGDRALLQHNYTAVVLAHADGISVNNNHMDKNGALILGPPGSSWPEMNSWNANYVSYSGNTAQGLGLQPILRLLPTPPDLDRREPTTKDSGNNNAGEGTGHVGAATACKYPGSGIGPACQTLGYASFDNRETRHRNFARHHQDATSWKVIGKKLGTDIFQRENSSGLPPGLAVVVASHLRDAADVFSWSSSAGDASMKLAAIETKNIQETFPALAGAAVYVAIQVSPQQNSTAVTLGINTTVETTVVSCVATAHEWRQCILTADMPAAGPLTVWLAASNGTVWQLSDLVLAPVGAPLSSME
jgi:hypothetical protein